ncbi:MAG: glycosyltransferase family 39 protein [Gorillibacterium sp.]|nr:glycosyltransferase family 39 protein [Gorillibacterium sp.]
MFSVRSEKSQIRVLLFSLVVAVFLISAGISLYYGDGFLLGTYEKLNNDDVKYVHAAELLLSDGTLAYNSGKLPSVFIMPGLPFLLAGFRLILERSEAIMAFRLFQCILQAASVYLIFGLAREMFKSSRVALAAATLSALYIPDYYSSGTVLTETTFKFLLLLLIGLTISAVRTKQVGYYVAVGVCWAAVTYFKPQSALYPAIIAVLWFTARYSWKEILKYGSILAITFCMLLSPWWIRNMLTFGEPILLTKSAGNPFLLGTLIYYGAPSQKFYEQYPEYTSTLFKGSDAEDMLAGKRILRYGLTNKPLRYVSWYTVEKFYLLFSKPFYWKPILGLNNLTVKVWHLFLFFSGVVGFAISLRRRKFVQLLPLFLTLGYFSAVYLPFITFSRYGYPLMPIFLMYAAYAGVEVTDSFRQRSSRQNRNERGIIEQG